MIYLLDSKAIVRLEMTTTDLDYSANMAQHASDVDGMKDAKERYILANDFEEIDRMSYQHKWVKGSSGGLIKAPIDLTRENLRILDSATADGKSLRRG